jgi:hypothetical protein
VRGVREARNGPFSPFDKRDVRARGQARGFLIHSEAKEGTMSNGGAVLHNRPEFDSVPTPDWFLNIFDGFHDPYPLGCDGPVDPPAGAKVFVNPGYSRKEEAAEKCIEWHRRGHYVAMLVPIESSTRFAKKLIQYGVERLFFERRIFPNCRGVELLILTGEHS